MYSPKIPEHLIPTLYRLARLRGQPMTRLVAEIIESYLAVEVEDAIYPVAESASEVGRVG